MSPTPLCLSVVSLLCSVSGVIISSFFKMRHDKILPATSACCGAVMRKECMNHFSFKINHLICRTYM
jgi:hypothetical protein